MKYVDRSLRLLQINDAIPRPKILIAKFKDSGSYAGHRAAVKRPEAILKPPQIPAEIVSYSGGKCAELLMSVPHPPYLHFPVRWNVTNVRIGCIHILR
jgi:hypothetical protein